MCVLKLLHADFIILGSELSSSTSHYSENVNVVC